jgi:hypothetical protein
VFSKLRTTNTDEDLLTVLVEKNTRFSGSLDVSLKTVRYITFNFPHMNQLRRTGQFSPGIMQ